MEDLLVARIKKAVNNWAQSTFNSQEIVVGSPALDDSDDDEADRYLVDFAVRDVGYWLVAEVWVEQGQILDINDLGEGLPLEDVSWPWATGEGV